MVTWRDNCKDWKHGWVWEIKLDIEKICLKKGFEIQSENWLKLQMKISIEFSPNNLVEMYEFFCDKINMELFLFSILNSKIMWN